jgi:hypothetical protein
VSKSQKGNREGSATEKRAAGRGFLLAAVVVAIGAVVALAWRQSRAPVQNPGPGTESSGTKAVAVAAGANAPYQRLLGRWVRPDGGYVIEIRNADPGGKLEANYFNPNPIHVGRAEASGQGSMIKVVVELRDENYPGSTYTLAYDPASDILKGIYFQAVQREEYEVQFARLK